LLPFSRGVVLVSSVSISWRTELRPELASDYSARVIIDTRLRSCVRNQTYHFLAKYLVNKGGLSDTSRPAYQDSRAVALKADNSSMMQVPIQGLRSDVDVLDCLTDLVGTA
jgi:hypothetical protein